MNNISKYITYDEAVRSEYASRNGIDNTPDDDQLTNIRLLCLNVLDRIRDFYRQPLIPTSIFRSYSVNLRIGGSKTSQHQALDNAAACDFHIHGVSVQQVFEDICSGKIPIQYDQVIQEFGSWIHISYKNVGVNRMQKMIAKKENGKTVYQGVA
jgi:hypothetical protein